jgi:lipopolysaccharide export system permease protein
MTTLFRYLAKEVFFATALLLIALLALFALFDLIHEVGELGKGNYNLTMVLAFVGLSQPSHIVVIFPVAALLGTLLAISRLSMQSELTVMRASGLSLARLAGFTILLGLAFSAVIFAFGEFVAPAAEESAKRLRLAATSSVKGGEFRSGFWVKDDRSFVNIQTVTPDTELRNMRIYEFDRASRLISISIVKSAVYANNNHWELRDVEKTTFESSRARIENLPTAQWNSVMTPDLLSVLRVDPSEMSISNLWAYIDHLRDNKQSSTRYELALWGKVLEPVAVIVMMLLAVPFAIQSNRTGGAGARLLLGIMIGLGFNFLSQLTSHLTTINDWPPLLSAAAPLMAFFLLAAGLIAWKENSMRMPWRSRAPNGSG